MANSHFVQRSVPLDCIRTLAITLVFAFHVATFYDRADLDAVAQFFLRFGFFGVDIFFPLSGFLITRFLLRSTRPDFVSAFFLRRVFRILPLYLGRRHDLCGRFHRHGLRGGPAESDLDPLPVPDRLVRVLGRGADGALHDHMVAFGRGIRLYPLWHSRMDQPRKRFPLCVILLIAAPTVLRYYLNTQGYDHVYYFPPARIDAIAIGGLTALLLDRWKGREAALIGLYLGLSALFWAIGAFDIVLRQTFFFTAIAFSTCAVILISEVWLKGKPGWVSTELARVGFYSYFIYLFHYFTIYGVNLVLGKLGMTLGFWPLLGLCYALTYVAAILSYKVFEGPMIDLGRRLEGRSAQARKGA